jgi:protein-S-isoprenylcysteine O-methyltransferase Ste14
MGMAALGCMLTKFVDLALGIYWLFAGYPNPWTESFPPAFSPWWFIRCAWCAFILVWIVAAFSGKRTARREPIQARLILIAFMVVAFGFLFGYFRRDGLGLGRLWPDELWIAQVGAVMTVVGVAFAIWARVHIGRNWSGQVMIKQDHELIRTGPYSRIRHPIYTGLLFAVLGTAIAIGDYGALVSFVVILCGLTYKAKREELLLAGHFGAAFEEHKRHTGFFLPRLT